MRNAVLSLLRVLLLLSLALPIAAQAQNTQPSTALDRPSWSSWEPYAPPAAPDTLAWRRAPGEARHLGLVPPARWLSLDPLAEKHPDWTPYNYVLANPLYYIDPDGRQAAATLGIHQLNNAARQRLQSGAITHQAYVAEVERRAQVGLLGASLVGGVGVGRALLGWALRNPVTAALGGTNAVAAGLELMNDAPMDVCPACFGDDAVRVGKNLLRRSGDELAPLLLGHNMRRIVEPIAEAQGFITLNPQGANFTERVIDNLNLLHKEFESGRRIFLIDNGTSNFIEAEKAFLGNLSGVKRINVGTIETPDGVFDLYEYVRIE